MSGRVVLFVQHASYEPAYQAGSAAVAAAAMGDQVYLVFSFEALRQLARGTFGRPTSEKELSESARGEGLAVPPPAKLLEEARKLGARVLACDTTVKLCGLDPLDLRPAIDEILSWPAIWRLTEGARTLGF